MLAVNISANDIKQENNILKSSISKYYLKHEKVKTVKFLSIIEQDNGNYFIVVRYNSTYGEFQDKVTVTKSGKILNIQEDLSIMPTLDFSC
jgi:hypothetical protein